MKSVYSAVRTGSLNKTGLRLVCRGLILTLNYGGLDVPLIHPDVFQFAYAREINDFVLTACFVLAVDGEPCLHTPATTAESL